MSAEKEVRKDGMVRGEDGILYLPLPAESDNDRGPKEPEHKRSMVSRFDVDGFYDE